MCQGVNILHIPASVLKYLYEDQDLGLEAKAIFNCVYHLRPCSLTELANKAGVGSRKASRICRELVSLGWLRFARYGRRCLPVCWIPRKYQQRLVKNIEADYALAPFGGEFLFGQILEFVVDVPRFVRNARPDFLRHPKTNQPLELDFYAPKVLAGEFNGNQHYIATEKFSKEEVIEIKQRDLMKEALCARIGLPLIVANNKTLNIQSVMNMIPRNIPRHAFDLENPYPVKLNNLCALYARKVEKIVKKHYRK